MVFDLTLYFPFTTYEKQPRGGDFLFNNMVLYCDKTYGLATT